MFLLADVVWPALDLSSGLLAWWVILAGLLIEWPVFQYLTRASWIKSLWVTAVANAASALLGTIGLVAAGFLWELFPGVLLFNFWNIGTYNPLTWSFTLVACAAINTAIELLAAVLIFKAPRPHRRAKASLFAANLVSAGLALLAIRDSWQR